MKQGIIYSITNNVNNKKYVGQTITSLNKRWLAHIQESKTHSNRPLYNAIRKYGVDNFKIKILEECNENELESKEVYWIEKLDTYRNGYNATTGGESNKNVREDIKEKISNSMKEIDRSEEWTNNVSKALKDKITRGEKWGFLLSKNEGGKHHRREIRGKNIETGEIVEFESLSKAALSVAGNEKYQGNISRAIKDGFCAYGYRWYKIDDRPVKKAVKGYDKKTGELIYEFESVKKAELGVRGKTGTGIIKSLKNPGKNSWMNCYWYYS